MKIIGIICEYNPFHLGHQKQFNLIRQQFGQDTAIVCLMSGNFVQRGAPAIMDKSCRAAAAAACGADGLMIEVHNDPPHALCDGAQSLTPDAFADVTAAVRRVLDAVKEC